MIEDLYKLLLKPTSEGGASCPKEALVKSFELPWLTADIAVVDPESFDVIALFLLNKRNSRNEFTSKFDDRFVCNGLLGDLPREIRGVPIFEVSYSAGAFEFARLSRLEVEQFSQLSQKTQSSMRRMGWMYTTTSLNLVFAIYRILGVRFARLHMAPVSSLPSYNAFYVRQKTELKKAEQFKRTREQRTLIATSFCCALIIMLLFVVDVYRENFISSSSLGIPKEHITDQQLGLLGLATALFLIPWFAKIKLFGVEYERN